MNHRDLREDTTREQVRQSRINGIGSLVHVEGVRIRFQLIVATT